MTRGTPLEPRDYAALEARWITRELADLAQLRRVDNSEGGAILGKNGLGHYAGQLIPYLWPGTDGARGYRVRRDHCEMENGKPRGRYMAEPGSGNLLYLVPGTDSVWLADTSLPVILTEGEFKTLSLWRLAHHGLGDAAQRPRFLPVGLSGVWNWRGTIGKATDASGARVDEKGPIPDLARITWKARAVLILFDADLAGNSSVEAARALLTKELKSRGARVKWFIWPKDCPIGIKGIDDYVAAVGPDSALRTIHSASVQAGGQKTTRPVPRRIGMEKAMNDASVKIPELLIEGLVPRAGLVLLGGRLKEGKSWLACQISLACVTGQALGGWLRVHKRQGEQLRVALWALEDGIPLTKDKVGKLLSDANELPSGLLDNMGLYDQLPHAVLDGGDLDIRAALDDVPVDVVILDSLFKLSGALKASYDIGQRDYDVMDRLRQIALDYNCVVIFIMHTKKGAPGGNPIENLLGTTGTPAAADSVAELKRYKAGSGKLTVVGRSVRSDDYELVWHGGPDRWGWTIQDRTDEPCDGETGEAVLAYLDAQGASSPATIASALRKSFDSVWGALKRLREKRRVIRREDKKWELAK